MAIYRAEVTVPDADAALPNPASAGSEPTVFAGYGFTAEDDTKGFRIDVRMTRISGEYRTQVFCGVLAAPQVDPYEISAPAAIVFTQTQNTGAGEGGAAWSGGGTLIIEKNTNANTLTFTTPLGTVTTTLSGNSIDSTRIRPVGIGIRMNERNPITTAQRNTVDWASFWGSTDGVRFMGAAMSEDQPGTWGAWTRSTGIGGTAHNTSFIQAVNHVESQQDTAVNTPSTFDSYYREWQGGEAFDFFAREIDMTEAEEHGIVWRIYSTSRNPETVYWQRTHDNGLTWTGGQVHSGQTTEDVPNPVVRTPNIAWYNGVLLAAWSDGVQLVQRLSYDLGEHWEPLTVVLTGISGLTEVVPRVVIHPDHGVTYYFFVSKETGELNVSRSGDFGQTPTEPVLIDTDVFTTWLDAWVSIDGYVRTAYEQVDGAHAQFSVVIGEAWDADPEFPSPTRRQRSRYDRKLGLSYHAYWDGPNTRVLANASPNHGSLSTPTLAGSVVAGSLPEQTPAVAVLTNGGTMVSYVDASENVLEKTTVDFGVTWDAA